MRLSGPFKTSLWERLVPQVSEAEPLVRHAVAGIGVLNQVYRDHRPRNASSAESLSCDSQFEKKQRFLYEFALKEYATALKGMRRAIENQKHDIRTALVACLLVFAFGNLQGNPNAAVSNAQSGLMLLQDFMAARTPHWSHREPSCGIEQDILSAFLGLDIQVLFFLDTRAVDFHCAAILRLEVTIAHLPETFDNLAEAMRFWLIMQRRNYHLNIIAIDSHSDPHLCES
jgi:hypothetical protein